MTEAATPSFGYELWVEESGTTPLKKIAESLSIKPPGIQNTTQDVTTHDSPADGNGRVARQKMMNPVYDHTNISGNCHFLPAGGNQQLVRTLTQSGKLMNWAMKLPVKSGTPQMMSGSGYLAEFDVAEMEVEGKQQYNYAIEISGPVTFGNWVQPT